MIPDLPINRKPIFRVCIIALLLLSGCATMHPGFGGCGLRQDGAGEWITHPEADTAYCAAAALDLDDTPPDSIATTVAKTLGVSAIFAALVYIINGGR